MAKLVKEDIEEERRNKEVETIEVLKIDELYSYLYDLKKNKKFILKYGLLLIEEKIKLLRLK